jgi:subtilisin family serine protease
MIHMLTVALALGPQDAAEVTLPIAAIREVALRGGEGPVRDPWRAQQWGLAVVGELAPPEPWQRQAAIAVCDTGVASWHEDVAPFAFWGVLGLDTEDDIGHGTHVTGIAAALTANGLGIAGQTASATTPVLSVKVLRNGLGSAESVSLGIMSAAAAGVNVINCSLQGSANPRYSEAAAWAETKGSIVVFAAGNSWGGDVSGMASDPYWIVVSSIDETLSISPFSSVGPRVDFCAPGSAILSCYPFDGTFSRERASNYVEIDGTSMAAPHVSGIIARVLTERRLTRDQVYTALRYTARDLGEDGWDPYYGWGLVQGPAAVDLVRHDRADFDRNGERDLMDHTAFQAAFAAGEPAADFDLDGALTVLDLVLFQKEWEQLP